MVQDVLIPYNGANIESLAEVHPGLGTLDKPTGSTSCPVAHYLHGGIKGRLNPRMQGVGHAWVCFAGFISFGANGELTSVLESPSIGTMPLSSVQCRRYWHAGTLAGEA